MAAWPPAARLLLAKLDRRRRHGVQPRPPDVVVVALRAARRAVPGGERRGVARFRAPNGAAHLPAGKANPAARSPGLDVRALVGLFFVLLLLREGRSIGR